MEDLRNQLVESLRWAFDEDEHLDWVLRHLSKEELIRLNHYIELYLERKFDDTEPKGNIL